MKLVLEEEGRHAVACLMRRQALLAFDFDGTLAPIVPHPDDARVPLPVARRLHQLSRVRPLAVVTGRSIADVTERLDFAPHHIVGNHGIENPQDPGHGQWGEALSDFRHALRTNASVLAESGVLIEDKGLSIALHYRLAPDRARAVAAVESLYLGHSSGLSILGGKCVFNVMAAGAPDKGDALLSLVERIGADAALFVGDDLNDEAAFEKAPPDWVTVRIGRNHPASHARFYLDLPAQLPLLLQMLIDYA